ncbi:ShlB/FhaC/HecB family hemolysin secretion/activation protein [Herbaspirillum seropedicae]|uniref:ShlB/FhaC/HecB family hemolysin secretion/activation protein n=1 Tax=Herbaspirillum seropedicae TaxID=964 RepID=UPI0031D68A81
MSQDPQGSLRGRSCLRGKGALLPIVLSLLQTCLLASAWAQADLSTQEFQRQQERERELRRQQERGPDVRLPTQPSTPSTRIPEQETPCYPLQRIALRGEESARFAWLLDGADADVAGRCLGVQGINAVMSRLQNAIVARGYVTTRVLAEPQDLNSGVLTLTILAGRVRHIRFAADADPRGTQWNALPVQPGQLLNLRDIEQGLENLKRVPTAEADIKIEPAQGEGALPGQSDLVISYRQAFPLRLAVALDDSGSDATGKYQGSITVSFDNWWTLNDLFYASFNHDLGGGQPGVRGVSGYTVHYSVPLGYWSLGLTTSSSDYHQTVAGLTQSYLYRGKSDTSELKLSRLVYRDASRKTSLSAKAFLRSSSNYVDDTEIEVQRRRTAGWELGVTHREFIADGALDLNLAYRRGTGAFSSLPAPEESFGEGTSRFSLATLDLSLNQPISVEAPWGRQALRYLLTARAQWNGSPLAPQERFSIGGRYTVRGFDGEMNLLAERGWFVRNELGAALGGSGQEAFLGLDYGEVAGPSAQNLVGKHLAGAVAGLRGNLKSLSYEVFAGTPLSKPERLKTASLTAGFSLLWSY